MTLSSDTGNHKGKTKPPFWLDPKPTAALALANGTVLYGQGCGATGKAGGEICFNTAMTGYQEILTDPSYTGQIVTFTFPHIGNTGSNEEDLEELNATPSSGACACVLRANITEPANYRNTKHFDQWLKARGIIGICGVDTRALTTLIREQGLINATIVHNPDGNFNEAEILQHTAKLPNLEGQELASEVSTSQSASWDETSWTWDKGFGRQGQTPLHVIAIDYGVKRNILRLLASLGCKITVVPATASADEILHHRPDGIFLSNGPGDPAATATYAAPVIQALLKTGIPMFGICLGHQILALALGGQTVKMHQGHHGANHPVHDYTTGKVEITSMNHGFAVDAASLPQHVRQTHISLFDGSNCGLEVVGKPVFSVQHHPEASPGPQDSHYLFQCFVDTMRERA